MFTVSKDYFSTHFLKLAMHALFCFACFSGYLYSRPIVYNALHTADNPTKADLRIPHVNIIIDVDDEIALFYTLYVFQWVHLGLH